MTATAHTTPQRELYNLLCDIQRNTRRLPNSEDRDYSLGYYKTLVETIHDAVQPAIQYLEAELNEH